MAALSLPQDVAAHLEAAIQLSNRRVHLRLLDEADRLVALNLPNAAIVIAGAVLESFLEGISRERVSESQEQVALWRSLRNGVTHPDSPPADLDQATAIIRGVRGLLNRDLRVVEDVLPGPSIAEKIHQLRGKYKFVATSSTAFNERKAEELRLERQ
ncbi:MAG: hypothetical protein ACLQU1_04610 [Bryobacteraceae bacterium]